MSSWRSGHKDEKSIYVVTTGGLIAAVGDGPGPARVFRVDVGIKGDASGRLIRR